MEGGGEGVQKFEDIMAGAMFMELSKIFDTINHELHITKLQTCSFSKDTLIVLNYLSNRKQTVQIFKKGVSEENEKTSAWGILKSPCHKCMPGGLTMFLAKKDFVK